MNEKLMNHILKVIVAILVVGLYSCGGDSDPESSLTEDPVANENNSSEQSTEDKKPVEKEKIAVVSTCETSLRELKDGKLQWTSHKIVYMQTGFWNGDTLTEKKREYKMIELADGSKGWVNDWCLAVDAKRAVITSKVSLYKEPDIMAISDMKLDEGVFVAVTNEEKGGYKEVTYKDANDKKRSGWLKSTSTSISFEDNDLVVAKLLKNANKLEGDARQNAIKEILENTDFQSSILYKKLQMEQSQLPEEGSETALPAPAVEEASEPLVEEVEAAGGDGL